MAREVDRHRPVSRRDYPIRHALHATPARGVGAVGPGTGPCAAVRRAPADRVRMTAAHAPGTGRTRWDTWTGRTGRTTRVRRTRRARRRPLRRPDLRLSAVIVVVALATSGGAPGVVIRAAEVAAPGLAAGLTAGPIGAGGLVQPPTPAGGLVQPPVVGAPLVVHPFRAPAQAWSAGHRGVDLVLGIGEPVLAPADGEVIFAGTVVDRRIVTIRHLDGLRTSLEPVDPQVAVGDQVRRGQQVATLAATPSHCAPAACLHWGVRDGSTYVDPLSLLRGGGPVVLLPMSTASPPDAGQTRSASIRRVRSRTMAAVCICEIRDSVTPSMRPISASVMPS